ncbi:MAG: 3-isopropylmalate dehydratase large subunit [Phascolarctobacterium sp.]|jgi:3-isopropylmalate/(R)-2-methylmalate dehydratase large subunit|nr:3-isopropylmalate dehydratase large subunit [Phascolarctobacterium sp.]MBQ5600337.1 3-isopropylmalate dehydratase large subunit [Phascolarctobacterium sp.]MBR5172343.1 3-isopropylmalate dehydratase large subunit [Phascolarctobacterium sp.]MBR5790576.1 3-isopropylmalate dehydratase large subunit [Phascolarctobacterium sp.]
MGMTMTEKILAKHAGRDSVSAGDLLVSQVDMVLANDITGPPAITEFEKIGRPVFDKNKICLVPDHFSPCKDIKSATMCKRMRDFAHKHEIKNYFEVGRMGIEHALLPDQGLAAPGEIIIGADSHTCTYGALNALSTGMGQTDIGAAMASGTTWFKVPQAIKVNLVGKLPRFVRGKDIILTLIGMIGVDGARYQSLEFCGEGVAELTMADRFTICNMAIEAGAKNGIFPVDEKTIAYLEGRVTDRTWEAVTADEDAEYAQEITMELDKLVPVVAYPHLPENTHPASEGKEIKIDQVVVGSCTNGRLEDLAQAAEILKGKKVCDGVRMIIIPATQEIYKEAMRLGYIDTFIDAGAAVSTPTCGPCLGGYMGILAAGERAVSTTNRNFRGRMGHVDSEVYLASPYTAAASAITGYITSPEEVMK